MDQREGKIGRRRMLLAPLAVGCAAGVAALGGCGLPGIGSSPTQAPIIVIASPTPQAGGPQPTAGGVQPSPPAAQPSFHTPFVARPPVPSQIPPPTNSATIR